MRLAPYIVFIVFSLLFLGACKKNKIAPTESFIKIYDDLNGSNQYTPLSIVETADGGYLILSAHKGWQVFILKIDELGEFQWKIELPEKYVNATPNIVQHNNKNYVICMDQIGLTTYLLEIDVSASNVNEVQHFTNITYPTYAFSNGNYFYIQSYDRNSRRTVLSKLSGNLSAVAVSAHFNVNTDVENRIIEHVTFSGKRMPFFIRTTPENSHIVMGCFYNYSFSTLFLDENLNLTGVYNGAHYDGSISNLLPLGNDFFAVSRFSFQNLYFQPVVSLNPNTIVMANSIPAQGYAELNPDRPSIIFPLMIGDTSYISFVASTWSNEMSIYFFENEERKGVHTIGQNVPFYAADISKTSDDGLIILVQVRIMGKFPRIGTIRLSSKELEGFVSG
jgi:hypothetical protein